jgi:hypothetical protein
MKKTLLVTSLIAISLAGNALGSITLTLAAEPAALPPAIRPTLHVTATNSGAASAELSRTVALQVTTADGSGFVAWTTFRSNRFTTTFPGTSQPIVLGAGESRDLTFWTNADGPAWFASDPRLYVPGAYRLRLVADSALDSEVLGGISRALDQPGLMNPVVSNEVAFVVQTPQGPDAEVWQLIQGLDVAPLWAASLAPTIAANYAHSTYAAYAVPTADPPDAAKQIELFRNALALNPAPSMADEYRFTIAKLEIQRMFRFSTDGKIDLAVTSSDSARTILEDLSKHAHDPELRSSAAEEIALNVMTRDEIAAEQLALHGQAPAKLTPYLDCVAARPDGTLVVYFGYGNPTDKAINLAVGVDNKFTSVPFDRGQPTSFQAGVHHLVFTVVLDRPELVWHLHNDSLHVSKDAARCPSDVTDGTEAASAIPNR